MKVVIAGAGVAGLGVGWRLVQNGCEVVIVERDVAARSATWSAAGMLSADAEASPLGEAQARFGSAAREMWPAFAHELEERSCSDLKFREAGALKVALDEPSAFALAEECMQLAAAGGNAEWLDAAAARSMEPALSQSVLGAIHLRRDADVDNRALGEALRVAFRRGGGELREQCAAHAALVENGRAAGLMTTSGAVRADAVLIAMGAWSGSLMGLPPDVLPSVRPAKGQLLALAPKPGAMPRYVVTERHVYSVPRGNRLIVGATVEEAGFDTSATDEARTTLMASAGRIFAGAETWPAVETWTGLRPRSADDAPVLGETALPGLFVASGQFRNGILFAPAVAEAVSALMLARPSPVAVDAFDPRRFAPRNRDP